MDNRNKRLIRNSSIKKVLRSLRSLSNDEYKSQSINLRAEYLEKIRERQLKSRAHSSLNTEDHHVHFLTRTERIEHINRLRSRHNLTSNYPYENKQMEMNNNFSPEKEEQKSIPPQLNEPACFQLEPFKEIENLESQFNIKFFAKNDIGDQSKEWVKIRESLEDHYYIPDARFIRLIEEFSTNK
ncbi:hypothetical protein [Metabacillus fastidiosus]|uniref:hypothetical protein n=1 Tax=Metabacillus fastidiosus TaxID=1458 RepID=UPI002E1B93AA|nr:hypothetical protein [Metabacillus fastidiosus]